MDIKPGQVWESAENPVSGYHLLIVDIQGNMAFYTIYKEQISTVGTWKKGRSGHIIIESLTAYYKLNETLKC